MPTPDASQFTQLKKYRAIDQRTAAPNAVKVISHLYSPVPSAAVAMKNNLGQSNFLPSFSNKKISPLRTILINHPTAPKSKQIGVGSVSGGGGIGNQF